MRRTAAAAAARAAALALTLLLSPLPRALAFSELSEHSFAGPFTSFDREGLRVVPSWSHGGSAVVNEHFVRLTPDRQSKTGWLWSSTPMLADAWSATLRFRVSGQGKSLFGDGVALWFTRDRAFVPGPLHGHAAAFEGFAIIFDTYVNAGGGAGAHRDVALLSSDGAPLAGADGAPAAPQAGCAADVRFWEGRQDFSVANRSVARISFNGAANTVSVHVDARGDGGWRPCFTDVPLRARADWWRPAAVPPAAGAAAGAPTVWSGGAFLGVTGSTGALADNHDVLSLTVGLEDETAPEADARGYIATVTTGNELFDTAISSAVAREGARLNEKLLFMQHFLEHHMSAVQDKFKIAIKKLDDQETAGLASLKTQEDALGARLHELEGKVSGRVVGEVAARVGSTVDDKLRASDASVDERLRRLETALTTTIDERLRKLEAVFAADVAHKLRPVLELESRMESRIASSSRGWVAPVAILALLLAVLAAVGFNRYRVLLKKHLL